MRTTVVPAQVTTVEDKIAGNLGFSQLLLLISPIFSGSALFAILPPFFTYTIFKAALITLFSAACCIGAIRFKGKIVLSWALILLRYNSRPMYYIFNKNSAYNRAVSMTYKPSMHPNISKAQPRQIKTAHLPAADLLGTHDLRAIPETSMRFMTTKKGGLRVYVTEIPLESFS